MRFTTRTGARAVLLTLCGAAGLALCASVQAAEEPAHPQALDDAIIAAAKRHGVPETLVRRIIMRESKYNPLARNHRYWGLMQISYPTAKSMGFKGTPQELLNPVVNLRYAVPYLANAFVIAGKREEAAVRLYAAGYYFTARTKGLLNGMRTADSTPLNGVPDDTQPALAANESAAPAQSVGVFGALFGPGSQPQPQPAAYTADASATGQPQPTLGQGLVATSARTFNGPTVAMVADKKGDLSPPRKWTRDGGMTVIARGEQSVDSVASRTGSDDGSTKTAHRRSRKITTFASLDPPPSSAQAYAAPQGQDLRFAAVASQAAIAQATSGQSPTGQPAAAPQTDAAGQPIPALQVADAPQAQPATAPDDKPTKRKHSRHAKHHKSGGRTQVAESKTADGPAPTLRPTAAQ